MPTQSTASLKPLSSEFIDKLYPEPMGGVLSLSDNERQKLLNIGALYKASDLKPGQNVIDGRGGGVKKRSTTRRRRSSKKKSRKMNKQRK